ncbi:MAG TPA: ferredoxin family protein [Firmicutes bacterium]|nr:ferredoxin family protein [Bacillota bacterium]
MVCYLSEEVLRLRFKVPREQIPWHPTVDLAKCIGCKTCFEFCPHGTYEWDEENGRPVVKNPSNCVVGCSNCAPHCPAEAIAFPPLSILKEYM